MFQKSWVHNLSYSVHIELTYHKVHIIYKAPMVWEHWGWVPDMYSDSLYNFSCEHPGAVMNKYISLQKYSIKNNLIFTPFTLISIVPQSVQDTIGMPGLCRMLPKCRHLLDTYMLKCCATYGNQQAVRTTTLFLQCRYYIILLSS